MAIVSAAPPVGHLEQSYPGESGDMLLITPQAGLFDNSQ